MEELFGVSMNIIMAALLAIVVPALAVVAVVAWRNRIMLKMGLRNIPRRRAQSVLIVVGIMLSSLITAAAFGTGDTISHSIRTEAVELLGPIDEVIVSARATAEDRLGTSSYVPYGRFQQLKEELSDLDLIDGLAPGLGETVPAVNPRTGLSEGRMRVAGIDPGHLEGFGGLRLTSGGEALLQSLATGEAYLNTEAEEQLDAVAGDEITLFVSGKPVSFRVKGLVERGGLAGDQSTLILPLERAQTLFGRDGEINSIVVSNRGDKVSGAEHSEEVTRKLRVLFSDPAVVLDLKALLGQEAVLAALRERERSLSGQLGTDVSQLTNELAREDASEELIDLLSDRGVSDEVLDTLGAAGLADTQGQADTLFANLGEFRVFEIKRFLIECRVSAQLDTIEA